MFTRYPPTLADTGVAKWPTGLTLPAQPQDYIWQLGVDLPKLPATAKAIDLEIVIDPGAAGALTVKDGDGRFAGSFGPLNRAGVVRVIPLNRTARLLVEGGPVKVISARAVGYLA